MIALLIYFLLVIIGACLNFSAISTKSYLKGYIGTCLLGITFAPIILSVENKNPTTTNIVKSYIKTSKDSTELKCINQQGKEFTFITYQQDIEIGDTLVLTKSNNVIEY